MSRFGGFAVAAAAAASVSVLLIGCASEGSRLVQPQPKGNDEPSENSDTAAGMVAAGANAQEFGDFDTASSDAAQDSSDAEQACDEDSDCDTGFCDLGQCMSENEARHYGWPCDADELRRRYDSDPDAFSICGSYVCRDGRCRSCLSSEDCSEAPFPQNLVDRYICRPGGSSTSSTPPPGNACSRPDGGVPEDEGPPAELADLIVGRWEYAAPGAVDAGVAGGCRHSYLFSRDGSLEVTATAGERVQGSYSLLQTKTEAARLRVTYSIKSDNGEPDCFGRRNDDSGFRETIFLELLENANRARVYDSNADGDDPVAEWRRSE